ncbi:MAG: peptidylprolyl isomerase [Ignavibacteriaceae bacterium]|jgi:peptidyl-prolyl cis-trans isomerase SurA|nr:peptidylprolyl isomerase [Ignavibacteriaceae bacterium]
MSLRISIYLAALLTFLITACSTEHSKIVIAEYDDAMIRMDEFENAYTKNAGSLEIAAKDSFENYKNFAELYTNFRMKLDDAKLRGYQNDQELNDELQNYKKQVGSSYILEKYLVEPNIKDLYETRKPEIRASHIMIRPDSTGELAARNKTQAILDSIKKGQSFESMVQKHTQDNFSKAKNGDIFYFTAGQLPYEFEDAAYNTPKDSIYPQVVQTRFGFHIIKVTDIKQRIPKIRVSHILISYSNPDGSVDTAAAYATMDSVLAELKAGRDFGEVAKRFSDDTGTKDKGGDLGFFERRMMVPEFDEAAFNLGVGQVSDVVKTNFGLHVIKLTEKESYPGFEEDKENLKNLLKRSRYNDLYTDLVESYKKEFNFRLDDNTFNQLLDQNDSTIIGGELKGEVALGNKTLYSFTNDAESVNDFYSRLKTDTEFTGKRFNRDLINKAIKKYSDQQVLEEKAMTLDKTDAQFAELMKDYQNGIFIFKLQEDEVWNKVKIDSIKLHDFYQKNMEKYKWDNRVAFTEIFVRKDSVARHYYDLLKSGESFDTLASKTERPNMKEKHGVYELQIISSDLSKIANGLSKPGDFSEPVPNQGGFSIIRLDEKDPARLKTFEEAKAEVSGAFQEYESKRLENEYLDSLKKRYSPVINYDQLRKAFTQYTK